MQPAARAIVRYYAALRIAAGSTLTVLPFSTVVDTPPIIRRSANQLSSGFDRREIIEVAGTLHVITLHPPEGSRTLDVSLN